MRIENGILYGVRNEDLNADGSFIVPNSVTRIWWYAFYNCSELKSVKIHNGIRFIGAGAFSGCHNLKSKPDNYKTFSVTETGKLVCMGKTYKVGKKSKVRGKLNLCKNGLHYCTNIFDIFTYRCGEYGKDFVIGVCEVSDENVGDKVNSKRCARWVKPTKILTKEEVIGILNGTK